MRIFTDRVTGKSVYFSKAGRRISERELREIFRLIWLGQGSLALQEYGLTAADVEFLAKEGQRTLREP